MTETTLDGGAARRWCTVQHLAGTRDTIVELHAGFPTSLDHALREVRRVTAERMEADPSGRVVVELTGPHLGRGVELLGTAFVERGRMSGAAWVGGACHDLAVLVCDAGSWRRFCE